MIITEEKHLIGGSWMESDEKIVKEFDNAVATIGATKERIRSKLYNGVLK